jgi:threonine/homoserine/homoserine lactone efflux protein
MFLQGALLGLSLSFLVGPLLFALLQASLAGGFRAGAILALGTWVSDLLFILAILYGVDKLQSLSQYPGFKFWAGISGGMVLLLFGVGSLLKQTKAVATEYPPVASKAMSAWFAQGFLLNSINPFTVFFWLGLSAAIVLPLAGDWQKLTAFFSGMFLMLMGMDLLKCYLAQGISKWLSPQNLLLVRRSVAILLIVFGLALIFRAMA